MEVCQNMTTFCWKVTSPGPNGNQQIADADASRPPRKQKWLVEKVPRRVIVRSQGAVDAKKKLDTDVRLAPFNLDFLESLSCDFHESILVR